MAVSTVRHLSRRNFFRVAAGASALAGCVMSESLLAHAQSASTVPKFARSDQGIHLDANENPLGPSEAARQAIAKIVEHSGRYLFDQQQDLIGLFAQQEGIPASHVAMYAGSSTPLHLAVLSATHAQAPVVVADPGYEAPLWAARVTGSAGIKVPLADPKGAASHDVKAMLAAAAAPGVLYVCNPNNPTGTVTPHEEIVYLIEHAPKSTVVIVDEAYIHLSASAKSCIDLVPAHANLVVLRTFSKLYGMAGLRLGVIAAQPALLAKVESLAGLDSVPVTAMAAGKASLLDASLVPTRRKMIADLRNETLTWLHAQGYATTPAESNCFMVDMGRPAGPMRQALAEHAIYVGREWKAWPNHMRVTVGTATEMAAFRKAFAEIAAQPTAGLLPAPIVATGQHAARFFS